MLMNSKQGNKWTTLDGTANSSEELCITSESENYEVFGAPHPGEANGPPWWANRKLFEAVRPSSCDLVSKPVDGSKTSYQRARRGYAKVSLHMQSAQILSNGAYCQYVGMTQDGTERSRWTFCEADKC
jgi:hypothetical protein